MLNRCQIQEASNLLFATWMIKERLEALPPGLKPAGRKEGYAIQSLLEKRSAYPLFGWKIAATSKAGQLHIGVTGPLAGRILQEWTLPPGSSVPLDGNLMKVAEVEFAFRMGVDLVPRERPYSVEEVLDAVATLHPSMEFPDSRFQDFINAGEGQLIADNACANLLMVGDPSTADWRRVDLASYQVQAVLIREGKQHRHLGIGSNVLGDPRIALAWLANELSGLGVMLKSGETVTTGTCIIPIEVKPGDRVQADYGEIGLIEASFI